MKAPQRGTGTSRRTRVRSGSVDLMGRRHFLAACGTAALGLSAATITGCGGSTADDASTTAAVDGTRSVLAGVSMDVRSDPG